MWHTNLQIYYEHIIKVYVNVLCYINEDANWHLSDTKQKLQNVEQVRATDLQQYKKNMILFTINHHNWILFCIHEEPVSQTNYLPICLLYIKTNIHTYVHLKQQTLVRKCSTFLCFSCVPTELTDTRMAEWKEKKN